MKDFSKEIRAYALKNAVEFGKCEVGRILPKLFQHGLDKADIKKIIPVVNSIVKEVNSLKAGEREKEFEKYKGLVKENEHIEREGLPEIEIGDKKNVVTRLAPEPSKYLHLGHAISFLLNYLYAKKNNGKCLIRFEDTNPDKVSQEYVDMALDDIRNYLEIKDGGVKYISDDMELLYEYADKLIKIGKAYICFCEREKMQDLRHKGIECECRKKAKESNMKEWKEFIKGKYAKGEAVLRIKGDMKSQNHVMRDSVIFRMSDSVHYRHGKKYKVWPTYDFYSIEDSLMGVTLILRSNEFDLRVELQEYIKDLLGLKKQTVVQYGRFNVADFTTKGREIRELIDSGEISGWDDPRLITLRALKRRGITKEAIYQLTNEVGLSKHQVNLDFDMIAAINRKIIDKTAERYSFVEAPVELKIGKMPKIKEVEVLVHPDRKETRKIKIGRIFISEKDYDNLKGGEIRLIHLFNVQLGDKTEFTSTENKNIQKINWVSEGVKAKILMENGKWIFGLAESAVKKLKVGEEIQFERFGFVRFDCYNKKEDAYEFWFSHQ